MVFQRQALYDYFTLRVTKPKSDIELSNSISERRARAAKRKGEDESRKRSERARYRTKQQSIKTKLGEPFPEFLQSN